MAARKICDMRFAGVGGGTVAEICDSRLASLRPEAVSILDSWFAGRASGKKRSSILIATSLHARVRTHQLRAITKGTPNHWNHIVGPYWYSPKMAPVATPRASMTKVKA